MLMLALWVTLFTVLAALAFSRPAFGVALYMLTFFAAPEFWWWGKPLAGYRWNLYAGIIILVSIVIANVAGPRARRMPTGAYSLLLIGGAIAVNATAVHYLMSSNLNVSSGPYWLLMKFVLLFAMIVAASRRPEDFRIILMSIIFGAGYIGYECTINDRGKMRGSRLEGVGCPSAAGANELASLMVTVLPLTGAFLIAGRPWERAVMVPVAPFILNVVLLCNSRGALLALLPAVGAFATLAPRAIRKKVILLMALGGVAGWFLLGDSRILERFTTTFNGAEERDHSASSRLEYWTAGLRMIADFPLGAGGDGFKKVHGPKYIKEVNNADFDGRAVHNGFINEACEWGVQGFMLRMLLVGVAAVLVIWTMRGCGSGFGGIIGLCLITGLIGFLGTCFFGDRLDNEWGYWLVGLAAAYARVHGSEAIRDEVPALNRWNYEVGVSRYNVAIGANQTAMRSA